MHTDVFITELFNYVGGGDITDVGTGEGGVARKNEVDSVNKM